MRQRHGARWRKQAEMPAGQKPLVQAHKSNNAMRIAHLSEAAAKLGLRVGQGLADAKAVHPGLDIVPVDVDADSQLLGAIADWCDRYTPLVALNAPDGLFLDVTGCLHLFGGEEALLSDILSRLFHQGFAAQAAIASTPGAAWAASHYGANVLTCIEAGAEARFLRPFKLSALRLDEDVLAGLNKVGLKTVGDIMDTPRAPLTRRFGRQPLMRLDQALGALDEALSPRLPVPDFSAERRFGDPIGLIDDIERTLYSLALNLKPQLEARSAGARALDFSLFRVDGAVMRLAVGTSRPVRDPETIVKLFRERIKSVGDDFDAGYGFDLLRLNVAAWDAFETSQGDLSADDQAHDSRDVEILMDRIAARLGSRAISGSPVSKIVPYQSHVPEQAERLLTHEHPIKGSALEADAPYSPVAERPVRLLHPPEPVEVVAQVPEGPPMRLRWRRVLYAIEKAEGPERIGGEWWCQDVSDGEHAPQPRDYYRVEDGDGRRFWIYREGLYGPRGTETPRWFMHGLFA
ncbi:MAG: DNA polymerase Y family protein [Pseudomonadota bacterium]